MEGILPFQWTLSFPLKLFLRHKKEPFAEGSL